MKKDFNFVICAEFLSRFLRFLLRFLEFFPREVISGLNKGGAYRISLGKEFGRQARKYLKGMFWLIWQLQKSMKQKANKNTKCDKKAQYGHSQF